MSVQELIELLQKLHPDMVLKIQDNAYAESFSSGDLYIMRYSGENVLLFAGDEVNMDWDIEKVELHKWLEFGEQAFLLDSDEDDYEC